MSSTSQFTSSEGGLSLYDVSIPLLIRNLNTTAGFLRKGEQWCKDNNHDPTTTLIKGKIADDMKELPFQVQTACNMAKGVLFRIGGQENTPMDDNEETFAQLYARIDKTVELLKTAKKEKFAKPVRRFHDTVRVRCDAHLLTLVVAIGCQGRVEVGPHGGELQRLGIHPELCTAQFLLPHEHGVQHFEESWRAGGQAGFLEPERVGMHGLEQDQYRQTRCGCEG